MAKQKKNPASSSSNTPAAAPARLPFELRLDAGDNSGARKLAEAAVADSSTSPDVKERAQEVLGQVKLDGQQFLIFGGLLVVITIAFGTFILARNSELPSTPGGVITTKETLIPPPGTVPAERPGDSNGTP